MKASTSCVLYASMVRRWSSTFWSDTHAHLGQPHVRVYCIWLRALPRRVDRAHEVQVLRHRLPPFLGEAFSGSAGLVDVAVRSHALDQTVDEDRDVR